MIIGLGFELFGNKMHYKVEIYHRVAWVDETKAFMLSIQGSNLENG